MEANFKKKLRYRFAGCPLLQLLITEVWFRCVVIGLVLGPLFLALFLSRIWRVSPGDFLPAVRVSGLDLVQARSLKRSALKFMAAGRFENAYHAWRAALFRNRADPELVRGFLLNCLQAEDRQRSSQAAVQQIHWLLRLTRTNLTDLELSVQLLEKYGYSDLVTELLQPKKDQFTPTLEGHYLKALFLEREMKAFEARWKEVAQRLPPDAKLRLYYTAYRAGWGPPETRQHALRELELAAEIKELKPVACRLQLAVSAQIADPERYRRLLERLHATQEAGFLDQIGYWRVLAAVGRNEEAIRLAHSYPHPPGSAHEALALSRFFVELGLREDALQCLSRAIPEAAQYPGFWLYYANQLFAKEHWDELRRVAFQMRTRHRIGSELAAYSYYLEGRVELGQRRLNSAVTAFQKMAASSFANTALGFQCANDLFVLGYAAIARDVLDKLQPESQEEAGYWALRFRVAEALRDGDLMLSAAARAYRLKPRDPILMNNYAAALLIHRQNPHEAIKLTWFLRSRNPDSQIAAINHAAALLLNRRAEEAESILKEIAPRRLSASQSAQYHLDWFEVYASLRQHEQAWVARNRIETELLYPSQRRWLEQACQKLPPRAAPVSVAFTTGKPNLGR